MKKQNIGNRFRVPLLKIGGGKFYGTIFHPKRIIGKGSDLAKANRILKTSQSVDLAYGDVIQGESGHQYICADNGTSEIKGYVYKTFRLFLVEYKWGWERATRTLDPVTGLQRGTTWGDQGELYISIEPIFATSSLNVSEPRFQAIINEEPQLGDRLNGKHTVEKSERRLGVWSVVLV